MIREAATTDVDEIRSLMGEVPGFWDATWRPDVLERALASSGAIALVHRDAEGLDGFVCAHDLGFRAYLSEIVVAPRARHRGIGSTLLAEIERRMTARGCSVIIGDVWRDAEEFYRSRGWSTPSVVLLRKRLAGIGNQPEGRP